jgi:2-methylaconitate cis-trans-isomerase PrpF
MPQLRCVLMRGGTSKAVFLKEADLPTDAELRDRLILEIFGSPDKRQIDGLGGADPLTSKLAIIGPPRTDNARCANAHVSYTFGQVEIDKPEIDYHSLCGNISAAVGAFAVYEGAVRATEPMTRVLVHNTNLDRMLAVEVPVSGGRPCEAGDYVVPGVPGTGARILIDFADTAGAATGGLLPTGHPIDELEIVGFGRIQASLVDIGNAHVFIRAKDIGLTGTETAAAIDARPDLRKLLERIRGIAAHRMGMIRSPETSAEESPATPLLAMVGEPREYRDATGGVVREEDADFVSRVMFMQQAHKTYAGTSTVCTGVAANIPQTVVWEASRRKPNAEVSTIRIGHPAGVIETETAVKSGGSGFRVERATLGRTARRIMEGYVFPRTDLSDAVERRP